MQPTAHHIVAIFVSNIFILHLPLWHSFAETPASSSAKKKAYSEKTASWERTASNPDQHRFSGSVPAGFFPLPA